VQVILVFTDVANYYLDPDSLPTRSYSGLF